MIKKSEIAKQTFPNIEGIDKSQGGENEHDLLNNEEKPFSCKDYFRPERLIIDLDAGWKAIFDTSILLVIGYSCFTTVFYVSFDSKISPTMKFIDNCVTLAFAMDFIFNFL